MISVCPSDGDRHQDGGLISAAIAHSHGNTSKGKATEVEDIAKDVKGVVVKVVLPTSTYNQGDVADCAPYWSGCITGEGWCWGYFLLRDVCR